MSLEMFFMLRMVSQRWADCKYNFRLAQNGWPQVAWHIDTGCFICVAGGRWLRQNVAAGGVVASEQLAGPVWADGFRWKEDEMKGGGQRHQVRNLLIAGVLGSIDEKIELNRKKIAELEALAKTIYDYWFVQFDFPDKNGKPYKSSGGKMVWNEQLKREVPEGWGVGKLSDIATITMGQSPEGSSLNESENGTLFFQGSSDFGEVVPSNRVYTISPTRMANSGDVLLSVRAPVGATNIALLPCCIGRGLASLRGKDCSNVFILQTLSLVKSRFAAKNVDGTTFGSLSKDELGGLEILKPPVALAHVFDNLAIPIMEQVLGLVHSIREAEYLRDTLLPLLMNGQIEVE